MKSRPMQIGSPKIMTEMDMIRSMVKTAPVNIEAVIRQLGLEVETDSKLPENISGQIRRLPEGNYKISSTAREHSYRQRFTLAHELGHYVLHKSLIGAGVDDNVKYRSTEVGNFYNTAIEQAHERQANSFAASILMPEALVRQEIENGLTDIVKLYNKFKVSKSAMSWRIKNLGLKDKVTGLSD